MAAITTASTRNCSMMSRLRAPTAIRIPISRVPSVTERTREIGIRMAVGARSRDIMLQFLVEAVVMAAFGGAIGILLGVGSSTLLNRVAQWPTLVSPAIVAIAFLFSGAVGVFFGFYPAKKAANLDPIEALRYE